MSPLISADWLAEHLDQILVLDASWFLPDMSRNGRQEFEQKHIPGARFFDFDGEIKDAANDLPHMLPSTEQFQEQMRALGLNQAQKVVVYDSIGLFAAPRAWWMLRVMGHEQVFVLDGGLSAWRGTLESGWPAPAEPGDFVASLQSQLFADKNDVKKALAQGEAVIDARPKDRFLGQVPEPRPGVRSGHMPGAINLSFLDLLEPKMAGLKSVVELTDLASALMTPGPVTTTCGSGVTAATLALAAAQLGRWDIAVYDGSWTEWGSDQHCPIE